MPALLKLRAKRAPARSLRALRRPAPRVPPHAVRANTGPQPPDAIIAELRTTIRAALLKLLDVRTDAKRSPVSLEGHTLESLGALGNDPNDRQATLSGLRASDEFKRTGRAPRAFDHEGYDRGITVVREPDGTLILRDGRHRFTVARELDLPFIHGTVIDAKTGKTVFVGPIPLQANADRVFGENLAAELREPLKAASARVVREARRGVVRVLKPERVTRIGAEVPGQNRLITAYLERVESSVLENAFLRDLAATFTGEAGQLDAAVESVASSVKAETLAVHADLTRTYSRAAGLTKYVWTTRLDEIVRDGHAELEGSIQLWSDPPVTDASGYRAHPGEPKFCRCEAFPWDDGTDDETPTEAER